MKKEYTSEELIKHLKDNVQPALSENTIYKIVECYNEFDKCLIDEETIKYIEGYGNIAFGELCRVLKIETIDDSEAAKQSESNSMRYISDPEHYCEF